MPSSELPQFLWENLLLPSFSRIVAKLKTGKKNILIIHVLFQLLKGLMMIWGEKILFFSQFLSGWTWYSKQLFLFFHKLKSSCKICFCKILNNLYLWENKRFMRNVLYICLNICNKLCYTKEWIIFTSELLYWGCVIWMYFLILILRKEFLFDLLCSPSTVVI